MNRLLFVFWLFWFIRLFGGCCFGNSILLWNYRQRKSETETETLILFANRNLYNFFFLFFLFHLLMKKFIKVALVVFMTCFIVLIRIERDLSLVGQWTNVSNSFDINTSTITTKKNLFFYSNYEFFKEKNMKIKQMIAFI